MPFSVLEEIQVDASEIAGFRSDPQITTVPGIRNGYLAAMESTCSMDIKTVSGMKNVLFGGEGLFNTEVVGPGKVYLQTQPINNLAKVLRPYFPSNNN